MYYKNHIMKLDLFKDANMFRKLFEDDLTSLNLKTGHSADTFISFSKQLL